ncbi:MAG: DUF928 domain-containing protein, partial [Prochlorotrichaceae cyanobacterium]
IVLSIVIFAGVVQIVQAEPLLPESITLVSHAFDPPNEGEPVLTLGGATRGSCSDQPVANVQFFKVTDPGNPPLLKAVLPPHLAKAVFFNLRNPQGQTLYQGLWAVDDVSHAVRIPLTTLAPLSSDEQYQWSMAILCGSTTLRPDSPVYKGTW